jgi:hypothetical protein
MKNKIPIQFRELTDNEAKMVVNFLAKGDNGWVGILDCISREVILRTCADKTSHQLVCEMYDSAIKYYRNLDEIS